ncbi:ribosomal RNA processing protein 1 homolog A-like isoform X2 [Myotis lucifugus]|uniref:ribosomal RNA processing protein 1 homolog A-like isoform X2 n=1 Tax=Myotis lucifugus TaxID=59463 RepID=UPI000CCC0F57|nr:ribosomal RNA processing protein 1 homolog A-like isoform X2 [Myotis lucifugus]
MVPRVQLSPEIQLAQRLAGNAQVTRDRAVRKLRKYIVARTQRAAGGTRKDHLPACPRFSNHREHLFLQTFWQTMSREWTGIDRLRLDKFYMLWGLLCVWGSQTTTGRGAI